MMSNRKSDNSPLSHKLVLGIDPGLKGAFVWLSVNGMTFEKMPLTPEGRICFDSVREILATNPCDHIYLERAVAFAMGVTGAFNYGRDFQTILNAINLSEIPLTLVEPSRWAKVMHEGIDKRLKPKDKSVLALDRLYPKLRSVVPKGPRSGKYDEGVLDALLIAGFGLRQSK